MKKLNRAAFEELVLEGSGPCVVMFTRTSCHVCKAVHPKVEELEEDNPQVPFYEIDVEEETTMLPQFHLKGVPQTLFFKDGEFKRVITGDAPEDEFNEILESIL